MERVTIAMVDFDGTNPKRRLMIGYAVLAFVRMTTNRFDIILSMIAFPMCVTTRLNLNCNYFKLTCTIMLLISN